MNKKTLLSTIALCLLSTFAIGQKFTQKGETISYGKEAMFEVKVVEYYKGAHKRLNDLDGVMIAYIMNMNNYMGSTNMYNVSFPATKQAAYINITKGGDMDLLKLLNDNGVFKDGKVSKDGVNSLTPKGHTIINDFEFKEPENQDKELKAKLAERPKESQEEFRERMGFSDPNEPKPSKGSGTSSATSTPTSSNVSFSLKNNCSNRVRVFIGTKPKYGSGTTGWVSGNSIGNRNGTVGDQICIVDESDNPISCMTISSGMSRVDISSSGTGFGN